MSRTKPIYLAEDTIDRTELQKLCDWIMSNNRLTKSEVTAEFEKQISQIVGSRYAIYVNSGSSANLLLLNTLQEMGKLRNGVVIAPAVSWVTTVTPAMQLGLQVHLCDCNLQDLGLDLDHLEKLFEQYRPDAVIAVHVLGHPNDMARLQGLCDQYDVLLIEDACEALGTRHSGRYLGTFGIGGTFSFYFGHQLSTIEGGVIVTDDAELYNVMLSMRAHGWARDLEPQVRKSWEAEYHIDEFQSLYSFYFPGYNFRPTDLGAFLGLLQLNKMQQMVTARERNFLLYRSNMAPDFWAQNSRYDALASFAYATLVENRDKVYQILRESNIESRPLVCGNIGRQPFWIKKRGLQSLPNADLVHFKGMYFPNHQNLDEDGVKFVCESINGSAVAVKL